MDRQPLAEPVLIVRRINHGFRLQKISRFINCILRALRDLGLIWPVSLIEIDVPSRSAGNPSRPDGNSSQNTSRTDDLEMTRTMSAIAQAFCGNGRSDGGSGRGFTPRFTRGFTTRVHHEGSPRRFTTRVHHEGSPRGFTTRVHHGGSPRRFTTRVHHGGSRRGFTRRFRTMGRTERVCEDELSS